MPVILNSKGWSARPTLLYLSGRPSVSNSCSFVHKNQNYIVGGTGDNRNDYFYAELVRIENQKVLFTK